MLHIINDCPDVDDIDGLYNLYFDETPPSGAAPGDDDIGDLHDIRDIDDVPAWDVPW